MAKLPGEQYSLIDAYIMHPLFGTPPTPQERIQKTRQTVIQVKKDLEREIGRIDVDQEYLQKDIAKAGAAHNKLLLTRHAKTYVAAQRKRARYEKNCTLTNNFLLQLEDIVVQEKLSNATIILNDCMSEIGALSDPHALMNTIAQFQRRMERMKQNSEMLQDAMEGSQEEDDAMEDQAVAALVEAELEKSATHLVEQMPIVRGAELRPSANRKEDNAILRDVEKFLNKK